MNDDSDRLERLGARIKTLREARGLTQEALAELVDVDGQTIQRVERAKIAPSLARVFGIADALGVSMAELFDAAGAAVEVAGVTPSELAVLSAYRATPEERRELALRVLREIERG